MQNKKFTMVRSRKYLPIPSYWNALAMTDKRFDKIYGGHINSYCHYYSSAGEVMVFFQTNEWECFAKAIIDCLLNKPLFFHKLNKKQKQLGRKLYKFSNKILQQKREVKLSQLLHNYKKIQNYWIDYNVYNMPAWLVSADCLKSYIESHLPQNITAEDKQNLFLPIEESLTYQEKKYLYYAASIINNRGIKKDRLILQFSKQLSKRFGWLPVSYDCIDFWNQDYYIRKLINILSQNKKSIKKIFKELSNYSSNQNKFFKIILKKYKFDSDIRRAVTILQKLYIFQDERKKYTFTAHITWRKIALAIAKTLDIDFNVMKYVLLDEFICFYSNKNMLYKLLNKRIKNDLLIEGRFNNTPNLIVGKRARIMVEKLKGAVGNNNEKLKGNVAYRGNHKIVGGKVKILLSSRETKKFPIDCILVTTMTSPDYIEAVRRAKAIITDEGGIICHAAIISRELGIPCITGTRRAVSLLQDGDTVKMDLEKGIIKKFHK